MNARELRAFDELLEKARRDPDITEYLKGCVATFRAWVEERLDALGGDR